MRAEYGPWEKTFDNLRELYSKSVELAENTGKLTRNVSLEKAAGMVSFATGVIGAKLDESWFRSENQMKAYWKNRKFSNTVKYKARKNGRRGHIEQVTVKEYSWINGHWNHVNTKISKPIVVKLKKMTAIG